MRITVWSHIEVKEIPSTYVLYKSISLFGGIYKVKQPTKVTHLFLEEF